jgi:hypothetical protein
MTPKDMERSARLKSGKEALPTLNKIKSITPEYTIRSYRFETPPAMINKDARLFLLQ